jgi:hypothetical protein
MTKEELEEKVKRCAEMNPEIPLYVIREILETLEEPRILAEIFELEGEDNE